MKKNENGFSLVEILLMLVVLGMVSFAGYFVWHTHHKNTTSTAGLGRQTNSSAAKSTDKTAPATPVDTSLPKPEVGTIAAGPGADWNTYTNTTDGFSLQIPKQFLSSYGVCNKVTEGSSYSYRPKQALAQVTVVPYNNFYYVAPVETYQLTGSKTVNGSTSFSGCEKVTTTPDVIKNYKSNNLDRYLLDVLPLQVSNAKTQQDVLTWAKTYFKDNTIVISSAETNAGGWQDIHLDCTSSTPCDQFNYKFDLRLYAAKGKLVYLEYGQAGKMMKPDGNSFYDADVFNSIKLL
jgi:Flp pilus assembly protein TadG